VDDVTERTPKVETPDITEGEKVSLPGEDRQASRFPPGEVKGGVTKAAVHPHVAVGTTRVPILLQEGNVNKRTVFLRGVKDAVDHPGKGEAAGASAVGVQKRNGVAVVTGASVQVDHLSDVLGDTRIMTVVVVAAVNPKQSITIDEDAKDTI